MSVSALRKKCHAEQASSANERVGTALTDSSQSQSLQEKRSGSASKYSTSNRSSDLAVRNLNLNLGTELPVRFGAMRVMRVVLGKRSPPHLSLLIWIASSGHLVQRPKPCSAARTVKNSLPRTHLLVLALALGRAVPQHMTPNIAEALLQSTLPQVELTTGDDCPTFRGSMTLAARS